MFIHFGYNIPQTLMWGFLQNMISSFIIGNGAENFLHPLELDDEKFMSDTKLTRLILFLRSQHQYSLVM